MIAATPEESSDGTFRYQGRHKSPDGDEYLMLLQQNQRLSSGENSMEQRDRMFNNVTPMLDGGTGSDGTNRAAKFRRQKEGENHKPKTQRGEVYVADSKNKQPLFQSGSHPTLLQ